MGPNSLFVHYDGTCPISTEERNVIMKNWECDQILDYQSLELTCQISMLACKSIEVGLYVFLFVIFGQRYMKEKKEGNGYTTKLPLMVTILVILEDIFYVFRLNAALPVWHSQEP